MGLKSIFLVMWGKLNSIKNIKMVGRFINVIKIVHSIIFVLFKLKIKFPVRILLH